MATISEKAKDGVVRLTTTTTRLMSKEDIDDRIDDINREIASLQERKNEILGWKKPLDDEKEDGG